MTNTTDPSARALHARLREVESGIFQAEYPGELNPSDPDERALPDSHIGTDPSSVRLWVEQMARSMGYRSVVWEP
ncbi:MAG TPA: hypothetical protein VN702_22855 [Acetobacteraceae bacterium]|nr:hypothetical protein [Acetobacteraceae bacterium]